MGNDLSSVKNGGMYLSDARSLWSIDEIDKRNR